MLVLQRPLLSEPESTGVAQALRQAGCVKFAVSDDPVDLSRQR